MSTNLAIAEPLELEPRPLITLARLIGQDLRQGQDAAEKAALPYFIAAGHKLIEAKKAIGHGGFEAWVRNDLDISPRTARVYMALAEAETENGSTLPISSLREFIEQNSKRRHTPRKHYHDLLAELLESPCPLLQENIDHLVAMEAFEIGCKLLAARWCKRSTDVAIERLNRVRDRVKRQSE